ncbi:sodium-dependent transporter [Ruania alba]|uniref:Neurotransmitter:Na+ symporter, NSS family n=1 Tax=Ruania alba TaxID=648782 RepID=A0A1H5ND63_9MICO|nr:sodium-dependent transporter [Ruania alba]SEE99495.1 neurotransmitter:Na+ symporter, NSS family [Ruania alba]
MSERQQFKGRRAFIFAAIGSAVGLGNIWRFPYVAYEGGGGAFILPYLVALLTAGVPLLFMYYAIGHKYRGSAPLSWRRLGGGAEAIGWWQVGISFVIAVYYAVIIAWAVRYVGFSATQAWGDDAAGFLLGDFLQQAEGDAAFEVGVNLVPGVAIPLVLVWIFALIVHWRGIQGGIARISMIFIPILVGIFLLLMIWSLTLPGAFDGLNALFTPNWAALGDSNVWVAAYGQIFFSLSIGFGIMITYSAHLKRKTNLTGSGLTVAFSNSGFELLAGVAVFATLGFMAQAAGVGVGEVAGAGIGLAFIAFPTMLSTMPGGPIFGVLFFLSLVLAGITSLVSIVEVVLTAVEDKFGISRNAAVFGVGGLMAIISILLFPTTTGLNLLDVVDAFANNFGIVGAGLVSVITLAWLLRKLRVLGDHLNGVSSFKVGMVWKLMIALVTPIILGFMFVTEIIDRIQEGYGEMPSEYVTLYGWGSAIALVVIAVILTLIPWRKGVVDAPLDQEGSAKLPGKEA